MKECHPLKNRQGLPRMGSHLVQFVVKAIFSTGYPC